MFCRFERPVGDITKDIYNKKVKDYKERQYEINQKLQKHTKADLIIREYKVESLEKVLLL